MNTFRKIDKKICEIFEICIYEYYDHHWDYHNVFEFFYIKNQIKNGNEATIFCNSFYEVTKLGSDAELPKLCSHDR